jgi:hypothetical protein
MIKSLFNMFLIKLEDKTKTTIASTTPVYTSTSTSNGSLLKPPLSKLRPPSSLKGLTAPQATHTLMTTSSTSNSSCSPTFSASDKVSADNRQVQLRTTKSTNLDEYLNLRRSLNLVNNNGKINAVNNSISKESDLEFLEPVPTSNQSSKIKRQFTINIPNNQPSLLDNLVNIDASSLQETSTTTKSAAQITNVNSKINKLIGKNSSIPSFSSVKSSGSSTSTNQSSKLVKTQITPGPGTTTNSITSASNFANNNSLTSLINQFNKDSTTTSTIQTSERIFNKFTMVILRIILKSPSKNTKIT